MINLMIVDDHHIVRMGLRTIFEFFDDLKVVVETGAGEDVLSLYEQHTPDVVLLDIRLLDKDGVTVLHELLEKCPDAHVIMLTTSDTEADIYNSIRYGAMGYILKDTPPKTIVQTIRSVHAGQSTFSEAIMARYEQRCCETGLSPKLQSVLQLVVEGHSNKEIADIALLSEETVKGYMKLINLRLGVRCRAAAVTEGIRRGIVHL